jgi:hypothetical protein
MWFLVFASTSWLGGDPTIILFTDPRHLLSTYMFRFRQHLLTRQWSNFIYFIYFPTCICIRFSPASATAVVGYFNHPFIGMYSILVFHHYLTRRWLRMILIFVYLHILFGLP